jgi:ubiquinone/menaquinone biosynthesis C-methylase UbiE
MSRLPLSGNAPQHRVGLPTAHSRCTLHLPRQRRPIDRFEQEQAMTASDQAFTGSIPEVYDRLMVPMLFAPYASDLAQRVKAHRPGHLLETAAGTGALTRVLASELPPDTAITATDLSEPMLLQARTHLNDKPQIKWQQADALALPFGDASFDAVVCQFGAMFFEPKSEAFAEVRRVLRPGGRMVFDVWDRIEENDFANVVHQTLQQVFPQNPSQFMARIPHGYHDATRIRAELTEAGFTDIAIEVIDHHSHANTPEETATAFCHGTPMRTEIEARGAPGLEAATRAAVDALTLRFGNGPIEGRMRALMISAA